MITAEELRELLNYDSRTGEFSWRVKTNRKFAGFQPGRKAGCLHGQGYIVLSVRKRQYQAHRLAWLHYYGEWPSDQIDHINCCRSDNRIENLRVATNVQNNANRMIAPKNKARFKGVRFKNGKWEAYIWIGHRSIYLGRFDTPEEAHASYYKAAQDEWGEFARAG